MKLIIAGGRDFEDKTLACKKFIEFCQFLNRDKLHKINPVTEIVSGTARGADKTGEWVAGFYSIPVAKFPADWDKHGKRAGYLRNAEMADCADALLAFWDGKSKGTKHMIDLATKKGLIVKVVNY